MGIQRKVTSIGHGRLFLALLASLILVLSSCVAPSDESSSPETVDTDVTEVQALEVPETNALYERCKEIVAVGAYAFGIGTVNSAAPFGGGGRVRWKVDDNRYERDADLDTAGEGVFCFRAGLIRQLENGSQESIKKVRGALEEAPEGLGSLAYIALEELLPLANFYSQFKTAKRLTLTPLAL